MRLTDRQKKMLGLLNSFNCRGASLGGPGLRTEELRYGSAEAYCTNIEGRWLDSMWSPLWAAAAIGLCLFYGWLLHKAGTKENVAEVIFTSADDGYETTHDVVIPKGTKVKQP